MSTAFRSTLARAVPAEGKFVCTRKGKQGLVRTGIHDADQLATADLAAADYISVTALQHAPEKRGTKEECKDGYLTGYNVDLDTYEAKGGSYPPEAEAVRILGELVGRPTMLVRTPSGGLHAWYLFNTALAAGGMDAWLKNVHAAVCSAFEARGYSIDRQAIGIERVLRVPRTDDDLIHADGPRYVPDDFPQGASTGTPVSTAIGLAFAGKDRNSGLVAAKGAFVGLGFSDEQANEHVRLLNSQLPDPLADSELDATVLQPKGWQPGTELADQVAMDALLAGEGTELLRTTPEYQNVLRTELARRDVKLRIATMEAGDVAAPVGIGDMLATPRPPAIITGFMTAGVYGLAGPPGQGKSLALRDIAVAVASGGTLWDRWRAPRARLAVTVMTEGLGDIQERWSKHAGVGNLRFHREGFSLLSEHVVDQFIAMYAGQGVGVVVLDMIYGCGLAEDNEYASVRPAMNALKRVATELDCAVMPVGHPPHGKQRRFRGSTDWRGGFDGEYHMADGLFTMEKGKYLNPRDVAFTYRVAYPEMVRDMSLLATLEDPVEVRRERVARAIKNHPEASANHLASVLATELGVSQETVRRDVRHVQGNAVRYLVE